VIGRKCQFFIPPYTISWDRLEFFSKILTQSFWIPWLFDGAKRWRIRHISVNKQCGSRVRPTRYAPPASNHDLWPFDL